ncbi:lysophospholipid acyltransferase family protein [Simiduia sp. 21SJ11W-1]|uniref:lysophospholipid acyltransferase family protein n=1 Tax=Simiduia sp. 21SJ11W-1 TaxID=2909669 RepID=UPI00209F684A|nr:lysophospholipid acyltransferase family protein [Simiduia sp. 21SJ11W-1]UTA46381.1 lysophospholipid acyltransferase family protein [Simiduia sp. 21SJ11W-1]
MGGSKLQRRSSDEHLAAQRFRWQFLTPRYWLLWLWFAVLWLVSQLPYCCVRAIGRAAGLVLFRVVPARRRVALRNLALCFPELSETERWHLAREHFASAGFTLFESGWVWWGSRKRFEAFFDIQGAEILEALTGKPVLFFGLHNTCVEMAYAYLSLQRPLNVLFRVNNNPLWEYMATRSRSRYQVRLIPRKQVPEFIARLSAGEAGLIAADQDLGRKRSLFVPFFGVEAATVPSVHEFARAACAQVVFAEAFRAGNGRYVVRLKLLQNFPSNDPLADTRTMNLCIEESVRRHPEQYLWMHKRFKTRPKGEACFYQ